MMRFERFLKCMVSLAANSNKNSGLVLPRVEGVCVTIHVSVLKYKKAADLPSNTKATESY